MMQDGGHLKNAANARAWRGLLRRASDEWRAAGAY
jgi:hypothetical protein